MELKVHAHEASIVYMGDVNSRYSYYNFLFLCAWSLQVGEQQNN